MEEERRIAYVAFTRAQKKLFLSDCEGAANDNLFRYPSRFLFDAELTNFDLVQPLDESLVEQTHKIIAYDEERLAKMRTLFCVGDRVKHPAFGLGTITLINTNAFCYVIKFDSVEETPKIIPAVAARNTVGVFTVAIFQAPTFTPFPAIK